MFIGSNETLLSSFSQCNQETGLSCPHLQCDWLCVAQNITYEFVMNSNFLDVISDNKKIELASLTFIFLVLIVRILIKRWFTEANVKCFFYTPFIFPSEREKFHREKHWEHYLLWTPIFTVERNITIRMMTRRRLDRSYTASKWLGMVNLCSQIPCCDEMTFTNGRVSCKISETDMPLKERSLCVHRFFNT